MILGSVHSMRTRCTTSTRRRPSSNAPRQLKQFSTRKSNGGLKNTRLDSLCICDFLQLAIFVDNVLAHVRNSPMKDASPLVKDEETKKSIFFAVIVACWHGERPATSFVQSILWPAMAPAFRLNWLTAFSTGSSIIIATRTHGLLLKSCRSFPSGVKSYNLWLLVV